MRTGHRFLKLGAFLVVIPIINGIHPWIQSQALAAPGRVTLDGSMGSSVSIGPPASPLPDGSTPDYHIPHTVGQSRGNNLFHSFGQFNIGSGETATFTSPSNTVNIIARVTGGASTIDGTIRSMVDGTPDISSANLFLLNPAGIMFGPNAALDIGGSFHASTADYLKFDNGEKFFSNTTDSSVLSVAEPSAFGFLSATPAPISGDRAFLRVPEGKTLSLIGGDITYQGNPLSTDPNSPDFVLYAYGMLTAPNGRINLASLASAGEVTLAELNTGSATLGRITLTDGVKLDVTNQDINWNPLSSGGTVVIRGGEMVFRDGGIDAYGNPGGLIDVKGGSLHLDNYYFWPANFNWNFDPAYADISHPGTAVRIDLSGDLLMTHSSFLDTQNIGAGNGGDMSIRANNIRLGDDVLDERSWTGSALGNYGYIANLTTSSGNSGNIEIVANNGLTVQNGFYIASRTLADGNGGNITVNADSLMIRDKGNISVEATGSGRGGALYVTARTATFSAANDSLVENVSYSSGIDAITYYYSDGGTIRLNVDTLNLVDGGVIATALLGQPENGFFATGHGADVEVNARTVSISGYTGSVFLSGIDARVVGADATGTGGNVTVNTDSLNISNAGAIRSGLFSDAPGNAGNITINAKNIDIASRGQIYADSFRGTGNSGDVTINATAMNITGGKHVPHPADLDSNVDFTGLSTTTNAGTGGIINVSLTGNLALTAEGGIKADTQGTGLGGTITVAAQNVHLADSSAINSASTGSGDAGNINITSRDQILLRNASITSEATLANGGEIRLNAPNKISLLSSDITAKVQGDATTRGGKIFIDPQFVVLNNSTIDATAVDGTGGTIRIVTDTFLSDPQSSVIAYSQKGIGGTVDIQAPVSNISGLLSPLSSDYVSATALLRERCIARIREGKYSSFVVGGRDGLPVEPGNLMPGLTF